MPTHARRQVQPEQTTLAPARPLVTPVSNSDMQDQLLASKASESQSVLQDGPEEASPERELADLKTPENAAPIIDQYRMNHEWNDGFCGLATVISTLEANGRGEWNIHDRGTLSRLASRIYLRGQGSSGALMAKYLRAFGEAHATFTAAGSVGQLMGTLAGGRPVPVGFVSMGGEVVEAPRTSLRYGVLKPGDHHEHIFGPSGHWATVVGFEGPAEAPTHFLVNDSDTGAQLRMSRGDFERHTDARNGIWMIPY